MEPVVLVERAPARAARSLSAETWVAGRPWARVLEAAPLGVVLSLAAAWAGVFGWLGVSRNLAGGSHAEDLGFTAQVLANFLRGQFFRFSIYQGATWNTELDISRIARPDSLLAFHVEPMLLGLVPLYALGGINLLLGLQALAVATGALPAFRLAAHLTSSALAAVAVSVAYLLSPFGQWAVLADLHTSTLAAPLLLLGLERLLVARRPAQAVAAAALALSAREDVGPAVAAMGLAIALSQRPFRRVGLVLLALGCSWTALAALVIHHYSGGISPFAVRYGPALGGVLLGPLVLGYLRTLLLSGGWLGLLAPLALLGAAPSVLLNLLSSSPWMASGQAHYSALVLPFLTLAAVAGLGRLRFHRGWLAGASGALLLGSGLAYVQAGAGPLAANWAPASIEAHAQLAAQIADSLPPDAAVSASSALVPRLAQHAHLYVFPAVLDADTIVLDLRSSPAPTSALDVYQRVQTLLGSGTWQLTRAEDGLLVLQRTPAPLMDSESPERQPAPQQGSVAEVPLLGGLASSQATPEPVAAAPAGYAGGRVALLDAQLLRSPDASIDVDGPRGVLRTTWLPRQPLSAATRLDFAIQLRDGEQLQRWDYADQWWNPPDHWQPGQSVSVDVPDVPMRQFASWQASFVAP